MVLAFVITVSVLLGFLGIVWRKDDYLNALLKTALIGLAVWGVFVANAITSSL